MSVLRQVLCTVILCWIRMSLSITFSWPSFTVNLFKSENTTLHRPMTGTEAALFGSLSSIGAMVGVPIAGLLLDVLGRKKCALLSALIHVLAWSVIVFAKRVEILLACMFVAGISCAVFVVIPVYISEICQPSIRGTMASFMIVSYCLGMLWSYLIGGFLDYNPMCYACLSIAVAGLAMAVFLRESPVFLMRKGREEEAADSIAFYRSTRRDSKTVVQEVDAIRQTLNPEEGEKTEEEEKLKSDSTTEKPKETVSCLQFFKNSQSTRRAATLALILILCSMLQGYVAVCVYAEPLFKEAVPDLSPILCSVLSAIIAIIASLSSAYLVDGLGRRPLMLYSSLGSGICCVLLGSQIQMHWGPPIMTVIIIYSFCFIYTLGAGAVPFVLAAELFVPEISSMMSMLIYELAWFCTFVVLFAFAPLVNLLGLGTLFYIFSVVCFFTTVYTYYKLPETKGLTIDAIQKLFLKK
ncbi:uncharacterized protein [Choristoneura fumiferana]|uniref:uncharacterized protein n=1 Tax=Choristoneura fumiferana TaxID=7141 RepID=UPI003D15F0C0